MKLPSVPQDIQGGDESVQVCVRVRPFNKRELDIQATNTNDPYVRSIIEMPEGVGGKVRILERNQTTGDYNQAEEFQFSKSFWSIPEGQQPSKFPPSSQEDVYNGTARVSLQYALLGFNTCIFAYGQTGSGKTHTMMGDFQSNNGEFVGNPGLIPRFCKELFDTVKERLALQQSGGQSVNGDKIVTVQYDIKLSAMEIYNETVRDLFWRNSHGRLKTTQLKVRVHPTDGAFVDQLTVLNPLNWEECVKLITAGINERTVAATLMNDESSRSHSLFMIKITQTETVRFPADNHEFRFQKPVTVERVSHVYLVDLAGSERNKKSGAQGQQLKEAAGINQSLSTLKKVIDTLVANSKEPNPKKRSIVPYRESTLTHLLSHSLGGNSKTTMIATVSPHFDNFEETMLTLRYAFRAKGIVNHIVINNNDTQRQAQMLRQQIIELQSMLASGPGDPEEVEALWDQIEIGQQALAEIQKKVQDAEEMAASAEQALMKEKEARYGAAFYNTVKRVQLQHSRDVIEKHAQQADEDVKRLAERERELQRKLAEAEEELGKERMASALYRKSEVELKDKIQRLSQYAKGLAKRVDMKQTRLHTELALRYGQKWLAKYRINKGNSTKEKDLQKLKSHHDEYVKFLSERAAKQYEALMWEHQGHEVELKDSIRKAESRASTLQISSERLKQTLAEADVKFDVMKKELTDQLRQMETHYEKKLSALDQAYDIQLKDIKATNRTAQTALGKEITKSQLVIRDLKVSLSASERREHRFCELANRIEDILEIVPAESVSEDYMKLLDTLRTYVSTYHSVPPLGPPMVHYALMESGDFRCGDAPTLVLPTHPFPAPFYPLLQPTDWPEVPCEHPQLLNLRASRAHRIAQAKQMTLPSPQSAEGNLNANRSASGGDRQPTLTESPQVNEAPRERDSTGATHEDNTPIIRVIRAAVKVADAEHQRTEDIEISF